jgi:hypothetical protein
MGMTLSTTDKQTEALRRQALAEGRSMQAAALSAIDEYIERVAHQTEVNAVLDKVIERERGVPTPDRVIVEVCEPVVSRSFGGRFCPPRRDIVARYVAHLAIWRQCRS